MSLRIIFWPVIWLILLLPAGLLYLGMYRTNRRDRETEESPPSELTLARTFGWIAAAMPALFILSTLVPDLHIDPYLTVGCSVAGALFGLASIPLFLIGARGAERLTGPLAGLVAAPLSLLFLFSGGAAA